MNGVWPAAENKGVWVAKWAVPIFFKCPVCRGSNYFEVDVDVASSRAANSVVGMVQVATNNMVIDMAVVLEGHNEEELPEALLGTVRFSHLDMKVRSLEFECLKRVYPAPVLPCEKRLNHSK